MQSVYYNNLGVNKRVYDAALQCFQNRGRSFPVTGSIQAAELAIEVLNDHPEIFYVGQEFRVMSSLMRRDIMPVYLYSPAEATKIRGQLDAAAQSIISEHINDHQSDYDKVRSLHDYLKSNLEYDTVAASSHRPNERNIAEAHNIIGALLKHKCVCEGFAKAFKFLSELSWRKLAPHKLMRNFVVLAKTASQITACKKYGKSAFLPCYARLFPHKIFYYF